MDDARISGDAVGEIFHQRGFERMGHIEPHDSHADRCHGQQNIGESEGQPRGEYAPKPHGYPSMSKRYPTPLTVTIRFASPPNFSRRRRIWTSTVRDSTSATSAYPHTPSRSCSRLSTRPFACT